MVLLLAAAQNEGRGAPVDERLNKTSLSLRRMIKEKEFSYFTSKRWPKGAPRLRLLTLAS